MYDSQTLLLSRLQFAFTMGYHILWPAFSIGMASFLVFLNAAWLRTRNPVYLDLLQFWTRLFALGFVMGVVTGIVISYELGLNWAGFAKSTANVLGPLFTFEVLSAFFLEAGFIGIVLFGRNRVSDAVHLGATVVVALGTLMSAFWILAANSWMQTPAGVVSTGSHFVVTDWFKVVFNPSFPFRFLHMVLASYITGTFVVAGISAFHLLRQQHLVFAKKGLSICMWLALVLLPLQFMVGDMHGLNTREHQPIKLAAIEARWDTRVDAPLTIVAVPNQKEERNEYAIEIPMLGSLILTHSLHGEIKGLKEAPASLRPPVAIVFFAFRVMVGIGALLLLVALCGAVLRARGRLFDTRWFSALCVLATPLGFVAVLAGWTVTEVGRQPYVVYGHLLTADAASPVVASAVGATLFAFLVVYNVLLLGFFWYAGKLVLKGPADSLPEGLQRGLRATFLATGKS
jgi:cytochrome d ubiquinol oxidase subunit I